MEENKTTLDQAIELFEQRKYQEAFAAFAEIYNQSQDKNEREAIFETLADSFYAPNQEELQANYAKNLEVLMRYPYFWNKTFRRYEELTFQLFPVSDEYFYRYNKEKDCFEGRYDAKTPNQMRYFFENLDGPVKVENEDNFYNLNFLNDNVRASEDYAGDNHIYMFYDTPDPLERLMMTCDLEPVLRQKKLVFLVGEENRKRYPVDFLEEFQIDYNSMSPAPVRVEEIKRVCRWCARLFSGTVLSTGILGSLNEVQYIFGQSFHKGSRLNGQPLSSSKAFLDAIADVDAVYTAERISELFRSEENKFDFPESEEFVDWLRQRRPAPHEYTVKELFCGYFLFYYEKRNLNPRIAPMIIFDPHVGPTLYSEIVLSFPYHTALTCVREPIMVFIRGQQDRILGWDEVTTKIWMYSDYYFWQTIHPKLLPHYYGYRFEDLKSKPEVVCRALCKHLNLPYDKNMLEVEAPYQSSRDPTLGVVKGFDTAPLKRDLSPNLSEFDKVRLQMFYEPIQRYYGYPTFSFQEHPLPEELVRELFKYPFRFERKNPEIYGSTAPDQEKFHAWIQEVLQNGWRKKTVFPKLIPLEEPNEREQQEAPNEQKQHTAAHKGGKRSKKKTKKR